MSRIQISLNEEGHEDVRNLQKKVLKETGFKITPAKIIEKLLREEADRNHVSDKGK